MTSGSSFQESKRKSPDSTILSPKYLIKRHWLYSNPSSFSYIWTSSPRALVSAAVPQGLGLPGEQSHDWIWMCSRPFCFLVCEIEVTTFIFLEQRFRIVGHFRISGLKTTSKNVLLYLVSLKKHPLKWIVLKHGSTRVPVPDGRNHSLQTELLFTHDSSTAAAAAHYNCMH